MNQIQIKNWSLVRSGDPYRAPEADTPRLHGEVYGHPDYPNGHIVTTSSVMEVLPDCTVRTYNRTYVLGEPCPKFVQWCKDNGYHIPTPSEPFKPVTKGVEQ